MAFEFEWDLDKSSANRAKHGVDFDEASRVFSDPLSLTISDPNHSSDESRHITMGASSGKLLVVSHTDREDRVRIISARKATRRERNDYEKG
jgi:uncharacterized DUF497 family protein